MVWNGIGMQSVASGMVAGSTNISIQSWHGSEYTIECIVVLSRTGRTG
jgi:hypothetical protein